MKNKVVAFFDIDGTLYREGLITVLFKKFIKSEIIPPEKWFNEVKPYYEKWDKRIGNYDNYLLRMADIHKEAIKGLHSSQVEFIANKVIEQNGDRVYRFTRDRIKWHKKQGHIIITVSGSPELLVKKMAEKYGFDDYIGTKYEIDSNGYYTGKILPMWDSDSKEKSINYFLKKYNLNLENSYAYGDTSGDYSMLKSVAHPTVINPTEEILLKILNNNDLKKKINIIVERKDLIYKLDPETIKIYSIEDENNE